MNLFELLLCSMVCMTFPFVFYLFYCTFQKGIGKEGHQILLDFVVMSSFYLMTRFEPLGTSFFSYLLLHIPLFMAYRYERYYSVCIFSLLLALSAGNLFHFSWEYALIEFVMYGITCIVCKKFNIGFRRMKLFFSSITVLNLAGIFIYQDVMPGFVFQNVMLAIFFTLLLYITFELLMHLFQKGEQILQLYMTLKELEREKQIRTTLFKITHEIKNPIAVCKGYLDMFDKNKKEHSEIYIPIIKEEIDKTLRLLQDFLSMTKIKVEKEEMDINLLLEEVSKQLFPLFKEKKLNADFMLSDDEIYMYGDYHRLSQVMVNLLKNSVESVKKGGTVRLSTRSKKNQIEIIVEDNGCGIKKEDLKRMKEPFFTTKPNGTGLGVSLSNEIVLAHGGTMRYESKEGVGTKVVITLPVYA